MSYPRELLHSIVKRYAGFGAMSGAAQVTLEGVGVSYYDCAIAFAPDTALGVIIEAEREIAERGYVSTIQVYKDRPVILFTSNVDFVVKPKKIGAHV